MAAGVTQRRTGPGDLGAWASALRLHQWSKNLLLFAPLLLGGKAFDVRAWSTDLLSFLAIGCVASATYVVNDLLDLKSDRLHRSKRRRAFASGRLSAQTGLIVAPLGVATGLALSWAARGWASSVVLLAYLALTLAYSLRLKREPMIDVITLGGLYSLRLVLGIVSAGVAWSSWLIVFAMFFFTSLSFAKRYTELEGLASQGLEAAAGRGYGSRDRPVVLAFGVAAAAAAVLVLVMYLIDEAFLAKFYRAPQLLWLLPVLISAWLGRIWILCGRGELPDDPTTLAVSDTASLALGALVAACLFGALAI